MFGQKRYRSLNSHLRSRFGQKVFKIPLDAGFSCPNRDGTYSREGCYFCSTRGSGDFAGDRTMSVAEQFAYGTQMMNKKWEGKQYIAYLQAFTNTYAPVTYLRTLYDEVLQLPGVVGLAIATRPDCLSNEVIDLLDELNHKTYLWVEVGLQTIHERTGKSMNLHYDYEIFLKSLAKLQGRDIETCAHLILGLPGENRAMMLESGVEVGRQSIQGLKIHLLHVMKGTPLEKWYQNGRVEFLSKEEYIDLTCSILERIPSEIVIHRLTGDSPRSLLIGPHWSLNKWEVLNGIDEELQHRNTWQGKLYGKGK
ncbi:MAG: TIGR01212 family radical SAM protein [Bacillota bacterium]|nr:TIGR01212 family radical SAM protein [Bacillota bacterium]